MIEAEEIAGGSCRCSSVNIHAIDMKRPPFRRVRGRLSNKPKIVDSYYVAYRAIPLQRQQLPWHWIQAGLFTSEVAEK